MQSSLAKFVSILEPNKKLKKIIEELKNVVDKIAIIHIFRYR